MAGKEPKAPFCYVQRLDATSLTKSELLLDYASDVSIRVAVGLRASILGSTEDDCVDVLSRIYTIRAWCPTDNVPADTVAYIIRYDDRVGLVENIERRMHDRAFEMETDAIESFGCKWCTECLAKNPDPACKDDPLNFVCGLSSMEDEDIDQMVEFVLDDD